VIGFSALLAVVVALLLLVAAANVAGPMLARASLQDYGFVRRYARLFPPNVVVRGDGDPRSLARGVTTVRAGIDPKLAAYPSEGECLRRHCDSGNPHEAVELVSSHGAAAYGHAGKERAHDGPVSTMGQKVGTRDDLGVRQGPDTAGSSQGCPPRPAEGRARDGV
jgi:hypothetical protein